MSVSDLITSFRNLSKLQLILLCIFCTSLIAALDWFSGPDIGVSIFYYLPVAIAAWFVNRRTGLVFSVLGAFLWLLTDLLTNPEITFGVSFWNAVVRLGFFLVVVFSLTALRRSRSRQEDLMAFVIHDLRAPLGNMLTAFDLLRTGQAPTEKDSTWTEVINLGQASGKRMVILVDSLLDLSRLESGKINSKKEQILLGDLISESIDQVVLSAEFKRISLEKRFSGKTAVCADRSLTQRVLVNLLTNAIKFSPEGGVITVQAAPGNDGMVVVSVHDQGPGIPAEWQRRVFDKYGQVSGGKSGGSGLGLTFCKQAVEAQDGRIWLESEKGQGTILSFSLPGV